ncbi:MAG: glutathione S-transferase [Candidatus Binatia bacterium]|nr:MAG: glutathione S-transferase [Candidatus Binatia bacterium]
MNSAYRLFGNELSPYSVKVRSYLRFKGLEHQWLVRNATTEEEFARYAKLPLIPLLLTPQGEALQDSTPIIETIEAREPEPSITPPDPVLGFVSALIEEYADEWLNKPMFHYRWFYEEDAASAAERLAESLMPEADRSAAAAMIRQRMVPRLRFVGSSNDTKATIEESYLRLLGLLEEHLQSRRYLLGERPALADFGLYGQLYQCLSDPTPGQILRQRAPRVVAWIEQMSAPRNLGPFEEWGTLAPTLEPLVREIGEVFIPWTLANERALHSGSDTLEVVIRGRTFRQTPQKYHAKSLAMLRAKFASVASNPELRHLLERCGCLSALTAVQHL